MYLKLPLDNLYPQKNYILNTFHSNCLYDFFLFIIYNTLNHFWIFQLVWTWWLLVLLNDQHIKNIKHIGWTQNIINPEVIVRRFENIPFKENKFREYIKYISLDIVFILSTLFKMGAYLKIYLIAFQWPISTKLYLSLLALAPSASDSWF